MSNKDIKPCQKNTYTANTNPKTLLACSSPCVDTTTVYTSGSHCQELEAHVYLSFTVQRKVIPFDE